MIILGIDPGYAIVGYGVINKDDKTGKCSVVDYGAIETDKEKSFPTRLAEINEGMKGLVSMFKPDAIAVEELFFNNNITTGIQVAEARGVIICTGVQTCGNLFEYTPIQIKQAITGTGKADKKQVQYMTKMLLNLKKDPKPDDAADALAVALTHAQTNNSLKSNSMFDIQKRVYHKDQKKNLGLIENLKKDKK